MGCLVTHYWIPRIWQVVEIEKWLLGCVGYVHELLGIDKWLCFDFVNLQSQVINLRRFVSLICLNLCRLSFIILIKVFDNHILYLIVAIAIFSSEPTIYIHYLHLIEALFEIILNQVIIIFLLLLNIFFIWIIFSLPQLYIFIVMIDLSHHIEFTEIRFRLHIGLLQVRKLILDLIQIFHQIL